MLMSALTPRTVRHARRAVSTRLRIEWELNGKRYSVPFPADWREVARLIDDPTRTPIGVAVGNLGGAKLYVTLVLIRFWYGDYCIDVPAGYMFDGASIPRIFWGLRGFSPIGPHLWAALVHDWLCDHPEILPQVIADGVFVTVLLNTNVPTLRAVAMYAGVRMWSTYKFFRSRSNEGSPDEASAA